MRSMASRVPRCLPPTCPSTRRANRQNPKIRTLSFTIPSSNCSIARFAHIKCDSALGPSHPHAQALTEAPPSPESGWWLALCVAVQQNLCCGRVR